jgi:hypothetical protein
MTPVKACVGMSARVMSMHDSGTCTYQLTAFARYLSMMSVESRRLSMELEPDIVTTSRKVGPVTEITTTGVR